MQMTPNLINILMISNNCLFIANNIGMTYISTKYEQCDGKLH